METPTNSASVQRWLIVVAAVLVTCTVVLRSHLGLADLKPGAVFVVGVFGLIGTNLVAIAVTLVGSLLSARDIDRRAISEAEKEQAMEEVMAPALRGQTPPPNLVSRVLGFAVAIFVGIIIGSILGWIIGFAYRHITQT